MRSTAPRKCLKAGSAFSGIAVFDYADRSIEDESAVKEWHDAFRELNPSFQAGKADSNGCWKTSKSSALSSRKFGG
ncbi:hypothetical protein PO124_29165 [Bacillus licheniformis]|nr:hypothetical protein [Bacillus licheniformis]